MVGLVSIPNLDFNAFACLGLKAPLVSKVSKVDICLWKAILKDEDESLTKRW